MWSCRNRRGPGLAEQPVQGGAFRSRRARSASIDFQNRATASPSRAAAFGGARRDPPLQALFAKKRKQPGHGRGLSGVPGPPASTDTRGGRRWPRRGVGQHRQDQGTAGRSPAHPTERGGGRRAVFGLAAGRRRVRSCVIFGQHNGVPRWRSGASVPLVRALAAARRPVQARGRRNYPISPRPRSLRRSICAIEDQIDDDRTLTGGASKAQERR